MDMDKNPFQELYVTETAAPDEFVLLFSPYLVKHAQILFAHGNVILKGTQGSGKSMLLNLLRPEIRLAYANAKLDFPLSSRQSRFISAGINITRSGATYIGHRPIGDDRSQDELLFPLFFADFVNYWIVIDLLKSLQIMTQHDKVFGLNIKSKDLDKFAKKIARGSCWFGYLDGICDLDSLRSKLEGRITSYRSFHQANIDSLPQDIQNSKTTIGEPISWTADCIWDSKLLPDDYHVFIRIDQHEILLRSDDLRPSLGEQYRRILNKAISTRDPRISYKIGTRRYAWEENMIVFRTEQRLERERDYRFIDMDDLLRRQEDSTTWIFPDFARDVFLRRLTYGKFEIKTSDPLRLVMGTSSKPADAAIAYVGKSDASRALRIEPDWPRDWQTNLVRLFKSDPLSAKLAEVWLRQKGPEIIKSNKAHQVFSGASPYPWEHTYWKKERIRQALMQLASRCGQRLMWSGPDSIIALSGGSTLVFLSICQHIWDVFLRSQQGLPDVMKKNPAVDGIDPKVQAVAIQTASDHWYSKITEQPGGNDRQRFVDELGRRFQDKMLADKTMSYPGNNGFSLSKAEYEADAALVKFLGDAVDYGDLVDAPHTTKSKDRKQRIKWYLNPILSPHFRIPESHVKEPIYSSVSEVRQWLSKAGVMLDATPPKSAPPRHAQPKQDVNQMVLFAPADE